MDRGWEWLCWNKTVIEQESNYMDQIQFYFPDNLRDTSTMLEELNNSGLVDRRKY